MFRLTIVSHGCWIVFAVFSGQNLAAVHSTDAYILTHLILCPFPAHCVLDFEFDRHALFSDTFSLGHVVVVVFGTHVSIRVEWLRVHLDEIWHPDDPVLVD